MKPPTGAFAVYSDPQHHRCGTDLVKTPSFSNTNPHLRDAGKSTRHFQDSFRLHEAPVSDNETRKPSDMDRNPQKSARNPGERI